MSGRRIQSARSLLASVPDGSRVATLEHANVGLITAPRLHPAPATLLWYDYLRSFSENSLPAASKAFQGADVILVPRRFTSDNIRRLARLYQDWLNRCATVVATNDYWYLYRPNAVQAAASSIMDTAATGAGADQTCAVRQTALGHL
jgi:hypothetical protein